MYLDHYRMAKEKLDEMIGQGKHNFILYPYGEAGKMIKLMLNGLYGIKENMIIDNYLCDSREEEEIYSLDQLVGMNLGDNIILITSDREEIYNELREELYKTVAHEKCVEIFPMKLIMKIYQNRKIEYQDSIRAVKKAKDTGFFRDNMIYTLKNGKTKFFLPYYNVDLIQRNIFLSENYFSATTLHYVFDEWQGGVIGKSIKDGTVVDVGANIGNHTLYFIKECGALKVHSFEAVETTRLQLEKNLEINGLWEKVIIYQCGLSDKDEEAKAYVNLENIGGTHLIRSDTQGDIQLKKLDDFCFQDISFIKIDVEEMELEVLRGGIQTVKRCMPYLLIESFEKHFPAIRKILCNLGYQYEKLPCDDYLFYPDLDKRRGEQNKK